MSQVFHLSQYFVVVFLLCACALALASAIRSKL